jgi:hypothetical protein
VIGIGGGAVDGRTVPQLGRALGGRRARWLGWAGHDVTGLDHRTDAGLA